MFKSTRKTQPIPAITDPAGWYRIRSVGPRYDLLRLDGRHMASGLTDQQVGAFFDVLRQGDSEEVAMAEVRELGAMR